MRPSTLIIIKNMDIVGQYHDGVALSQHVWLMEHRLWQALERVNRKDSADKLS